MGCLLGKGKDYQNACRSLDEVTNLINAAPWSPNMLSPLEDCVQRLTCVGDYFVTVRGGKDADQVGIVRMLGTRLTQELVSLMDQRLIRRRDLMRIQEIMRMALTLDSLYGTDKVSAEVKRKQKQLQKEIATGYLEEVVSCLSQLTTPEQLFETAKKALSLLQRAGNEIRDVPELVPQLIQQSAVLASKILTLVTGAMGSDSRSFNELEDVSTQLDKMCMSLVSSGGTTWDSLTPKLMNVASSKACEVVPGKLETLEAEIAKQAGFDSRVFLRHFMDMAPWCFGLSPEVEDRIKVLCHQVFLRVCDAFDKALTTGATSLMEKMYNFARGYDVACSKMKIKFDDSALMKELERKKANVTIEEMITRTREWISGQCEELHAACEDAKVAIAKIPREKLGVRATDPVWRFRLRSGVFKDYSEEKSAEVEKHFQTWQANGRSRDPNDRRCQIWIKVGAAKPYAATVLDCSGSTPRAGGRRRCKYGDKCFRKNPEHRSEFSHPGDADWASEPATGSGHVLEKTASEKEEQFSLDFLMMTQVNLSRRAGMRNLNRVEGLTVAQKATASYFEKVRDFIQGNETMFSQADAEMSLLEVVRREEMRSKVEQLLTLIVPSVHEFMNMAVKVGDLKTIDEIVALLGPRAESLALGEVLKELRTNDVLEEFQKAYVPLFGGQSAHIVQLGEGALPSERPKKWILLRSLLRHKILRVRIALRESQIRLQESYRRRGYMRCQALLTEYAADSDFCCRFRNDISIVLVRSASWHAENQQPHAFDAIVKTSKLLGCDADPVLRVAGDWAFAAARSACSRLQGLARVIEVVDISAAIAKSGGRSLDEFFKLAELLPEIAARAHSEIDISETGRISSVKMVVGLSAKLDYTTHSFVDHFWTQFHPWYEGLEADGSKQILAVEWAIAFSEQLKVPLPKWMMKKDQIEAIRKLQSALESGGEKELREAVVFAKQADYKSEASLAALYDQSMTKLKVLKRLPSGWEVSDLLGDDAAGRMFKKADLDNPTLRSLFQKFFDTTKASIVTRDRVGAVPGGYRVQRVVSVMNAESWGSYMIRRDAIVNQCKRFSGAAPCPAETWRNWSGPLATAEGAQEILDQCKVPALEQNANECLMFHGTNPDAADLIAKNHFDMSFACKTGLFGAGLYFAENSSKSDEYVKPDSSNHYPMIVARVTLGRMNYCGTLDPIKDPGRDMLESSCLRGEYHSVIGDRKKARNTYREFIIYDHYQVYPHFIVWYTRL